MDTLLTKNGELIQIIEITGHESKDHTYHSSAELREALRKAIRECIPGFEFSVSIHTIRSRKNLMPMGDEATGFADRLNKNWCRKNNWDKQLVNTIYISIIIQGVSESLFNPLNLGRSLFFSLVKKMHLKVLETKCKALKEVVNRVINSLAGYGSRRLTILKTEDGYISEPLLFYYELIHLDQKRIPVPIQDVSEYLSRVKIDFEFNSIKVNEVQGKERYAVIFTVKEYQDLATSVLDKFLHLGFQFIVSQQIVFVPALEAKSYYEKIYGIAHLDSTGFIEKVGKVKEFYESDKSRATDYCSQQITILLHTDSERFFESRVQQAVKALREIGMVVIREDFFMPKLFWSQLPGNFRYLKNARMHYLNTSQVAGFSSIFQDKSGNYKGSKWGPPVCLIRSSLGTPYFFNFHDQGGNSSNIIIGPKGSGKTALTRFLMTLALKINPKIIYLNLEGNSQKYSEAIGGRYYKISTQESSLIKVNPFNKNNYYSIDAYKKWLLNSVYKKGANVQQYVEFFSILVDKLLEIESLPNKVELIQNILNSAQDRVLIDGFNEFLGNEFFANLFDQEKDNIDVIKNEKRIVIDLSVLNDNKVVLESYLSLLLKQIADNLDGQPCIIAISKSSCLYNIPGFVDTINNWVKTINDKNAALILSTSMDEKLLKNNAFKDNMQLFGNKLFLSDKFADKYYKKLFSISDDELHKIKSFSIDRRMILLKKDGYSALLSLQLSDFKDDLEILQS
jgi:type IV secretion system protein VirB4